MKQDTRNYGKFHKRFAELKETAAGHKPWYVTSAEGIKSFAEGGAVGDDYNTNLGSDEPNFVKWKTLNAPLDSGYDYDLRGAYQSGGVKDPETGHWKDTYKKPNHPTFSDQSQYATGDQRDRAGHWEGDTFVPPANK